MKAICGEGNDWKVSMDCDVCSALLHRRYIQKSGVYQEKGLFCNAHGIMVPDRVVTRQRGLVGWYDDTDVRVVNT